MTEFEKESIGSYLKSRIDSFQPQSVTYSYGAVTRVSDGVVRAEGLTGRRYGELVEFEHGCYGMVLDLEENGIGAVLLETGDRVRSGDSVKGTGRVVEVPVGEQLLGRIVDPIGRPLDGLPLHAEKFLPAERPAPAIISRSPVNTPLQTGIIAIDSMIPIGKGQRELIIGDRQTGKTSIAVDTVLNQRGKDVICIYCAIGQKAANISQIIKTLRDNDAMKYSVIVAATASDSPAMQYLSPYAATSIAEYFTERGKDALIVYDDLSKHAVAYRTMSLLLHRPPGREAYPGDVFYLHSRLLERAAHLSPENGGGSLTALPIIETTGGNISSYIPTNVISITDGQIYLESELFHSGIRPAINTGLSVSRVGRAAQYKAMRKVSGSLRIKLAQYREMAVFARFGADIDAATKMMLDNGEKLTALFNQGKNRTYSLAEMVILLYAFKNGAFEHVPVRELYCSASRLMKRIETDFRSVIHAITKTCDLSDESERLLDEGIARWKTAERETAS